MAECSAPGGGRRRPSVYRGSLVPPPPPTAVSGHESEPVSSSSGLGGVGRAGTAASWTHSLAERKRRERINAHLSSLRRMVPNSGKLDKAALLGRVIDQVKDLKRKASETSKGLLIPDESNCVTVQCENSGGDRDREGLLIRATICCDDRPDLFADLAEAFHELRLRTVGAEMVYLGGRVKNVFLLNLRDDGQGDAGGGLGPLVEAVREELGRVSSVDVGSGELSGKRRRLLQSQHDRIDTNS